MSLELMLTLCEGDLASRAHDLIAPLSFLKGNPALLDPQDLFEHMDQVPVTVAHWILVLIAQSETHAYLVAVDVRQLVPDICARRRELIFPIAVPSLLIDVDLYVSWSPWCDLFVRCRLDLVDRRVLECRKIH